MVSLYGAVVYHIVAKHVERALVEVVGANYAISVQGEVIARLLVHNQLEREVLVGVYEEVDAHIRFEKSMSSSLCFVVGAPFRLSIISGAMSCQWIKLLSLMASGLATLYTKMLPGLGLGIDVDDGFAALAVDAHLARGIDGTIEGVVAKLTGIEAQEIVRLRYRGRSSAL